MVGFNRGTVSEEARVISSRTTLFLKLVLPILFVATFVLVTYSMFRTRVFINGEEATVPLVAPWMMMFLWVFGIGIIIHQAVQIRWVRMDDSAFYVSGFGEPVRVPFGMVEKITQSRWTKIRPVQVKLRTHITGLGNTFTFVPRTRVGTPFWREDAIVGELRERVHTTVVAR